MVHRYKDDIIGQRLSNQQITEHKFANPKQLLNHMGAIQAQDIEMAKRALDAKELRRYDTPEGKISHAVVSIDDSVIMIGDANEQSRPTHMVIHIYVPDANATFKKAVAAGFEPVQEPVQKEDTDLRGMFKDFQGNIWAVGTQQN